jgi:glycosyltransferase involved in cell wall biosynthesis
MYELAGRVRLLPGLIAELDLHLFERAALAVLPAIVKRRAIGLVQILALPRMAARLKAGPLPVAMRFPGPPAWFHSGLLRRLAAGGVGLFAHGDTVARLNALRIPAEEIPPGVDLDLYGRPSPDDRARLRAAIGAGPDSLVLVSVGRLIPGKGHAFLLAGLRALGDRLSDSRLVLVGDGPLRASLERQCAQAGLGSRVTFAGCQPAAAVARWLAAADLFCLFSEYENYSNAVLEAMASGLPVLATRAGGFPLQVRDGDNGCLIAPGSVAEFVERACELARQPALRRALGQSARRFSEIFSWRSSATRAAALFERLGGR